MVATGCSTVVTLWWRNRDKLRPDEPLGSCRLYPITFTSYIQWLENNFQQTHGKPYARRGLSLLPRHGISYFLICLSLSCFSVSTQSDVNVIAPSELNEGRPVLCNNCLIETRIFFAQILFCIPNMALAYWCVTVNLVWTALVIDSVSSIDSILQLDNQTPLLKTQCRPFSLSSGGRGFDSQRGQKIFSLPRVVPWFPLLGLTPSGLFMGSIST